MQMSGNKKSIFNIEIETFPITEDSNHITEHFFLALKKIRKVFEMSHRQSQENEDRRRANTGKITCWIKALFEPPTSYNSPHHACCITTLADLYCSKKKKAFDAVMKWKLDTIASNLLNRSSIVVQCWLWLGPRQGWSLWQPETTSYYGLSASFEGGEGKGVGGGWWCVFLPSALRGRRSKCKKKK